MTESRFAEAVATATVVAGLGHVAIGVAKNADIMRGWSRRGWWDQVRPDRPADMAALWFTASGAGLVVNGLTARATAKQSGRLPAGFGAGMLATAAPIALVQPRSGAWGLLVLGALALAAARGSK